MAYIRVIRFRWRPDCKAESSRLAQALAASGVGREGSRSVRVLAALDGGSEGLVVFEWETREALDAHLRTASLEQLAPWAVRLLHWRTDQNYEVVPGDSPTT